MKENKYFNKLYLFSSVPSTVYFYLYSILYFTLNIHGILFLGFEILHYFMSPVLNSFTCVIFFIQIFFTIVGASLRFKNFIANDSFYVIVVHMTIKILNFESSN